jgi:hypothetical protein
MHEALSSIPSTTKKKKKKSYVERFIQKEMESQICVLRDASFGRIQNFTPTSLSTGSVILSRFTEPS